eukprot:Clim_evm65s191 gene=Clim_evmTU65s191
MPALGAELIGKLQRRPNHIRNICVLAHVDHGKTTLTDSLIASNGIISQRMSGKLRYLDSRDDEQERGITMKSSAISLLFKGGHDNAAYFLNLIDSPGHVDFSSEVSTAVRLSDGCLIVIDAVEGVCPQTHAVMRQAWIEGIAPLLVINKVDRLITELQLTPEQAYQHLQRVIEQANAIVAHLHTADLMAKAAGAGFDKIQSEDVTADEDDANDEGVGISLEQWAIDDVDDEHLYFSPEKDNVIFASAFQGWAFRVSDFAKLYAAKLKAKEKVLQATLWGDYYISPAQKKILPGAGSKGKKPLFVQIVLENLWKFFEVIQSRDQDKIEKVAGALQLNMNTRDARNKDIEIQLPVLMSQWLPLAQSVLTAVVDLLPAPSAMTTERAGRLLYGQKDHNAFPTEVKKIQESVQACDFAEDAPLMVYISKMVAVPNSSLPVLTEAERMKREQEREAARKAELERLRRERELQNMREEAGDEYGFDFAGAMAGNSNGTLQQKNSDHTMIAFARVYSGTLKAGQTVQIIPPRFDALSGDRDKEVVRKNVGDLYLFMGRELESVPECSAGNIIGIRGLEGTVFKTATISDLSTPCPSVSPMYFDVAPIVHVAIEPVNPMHMKEVQKGLELLNQSDPAVETWVAQTGEYMLACSGEVHLETCLKDLDEMYAGVPVHASKPIVQFRETVIRLPRLDVREEEILQVKPIEPKQVYTVSNGRMLLHLSAVPMPAKAVEIIEQNKDLLHPLISDKVALDEHLMDDAKAVASDLSKAFAEAAKDPTGDYARANCGEIVEEAFMNVLSKIVTLGPRSYGPNVLINVTDIPFSAAFHKLLSEIPKAGTDEDHRMIGRTLESSFQQGFSMATGNGPLCGEAVHGVAFVLRAVELHPDADQTLANTLSSLTGPAIPGMREACRQAFLAQPARLMVAMYSCEIQATTEVLGKVYSVIGRRSGRILSEEMKEGTDSFIIKSVIPVVESFGFAEEIRKRTSGLAAPQLVFKGWEILEQDPLWVPTTEEELEYYGEKADAENIARRYMNDIRRRKGIHVDEKVVENAEKQRTLKAK